jgi:hypothetical protein
MPPIADGIPTAIAILSLLLRPPSPPVAEGDGDGTELLVEEAPALLVFVSELVAVDKLLEVTVLATGKQH